METIMRTATLTFVFLSLALFSLGCSTLFEASMRPEDRPESGYGLVLLNAASTGRVELELASLEHSRSFTILVPDGSSYWLVAVPQGDYVISRVGTMGMPRGRTFRIKPATVNYIGDINISRDLYSTNRAGTIRTHEKGYWSNYNLEGATEYLRSNYPTQLRELPLVDLAERLHEQIESPARSNDTRAMPLY
jgi:hypothetical protein